MAGKEKLFRPQAKLPRGLRDLAAADLRPRLAMLERLRAIAERYGFDPLETPAFEFADALGKFLPDQDRPNEGVFAFKDDDEQWLSLRYDLTAPLARFVAQNYEALPKPFRRYAMGSVWRNEKPGPGRYREFTQFDVDIVGAASMAADAEMIALLAESMEAVGLKRGEYAIHVNNRKVLSGVLECADLGGDADEASRGVVLRAIDKLDRLGEAGVRDLLGKGRKDDSGDYTKGANLSSAQIEQVLQFLAAGDANPAKLFGKLRTHVGKSAAGLEGVNELERIAELLDAAGFQADRIVFDPAIVRGLGYYTGPVFEALIRFPMLNDEGKTVVMGSVGSGGRYDGLVERFRGVRVPATGCSVGVSRLLAALEARKKRDETQSFEGPVVVLVLDPNHVADYQRMTGELRRAGIAAEMYLGDSGMKAQMKYADKRRAPIAVIVGEDERAKGEVTLKDLALGARLSAEIASSEEWRKGQPAQSSVPRDALVESVRKMLARNA